MLMFAVVVFQSLFGDQNFLVALVFVLWSAGLLSELKTQPNHSRAKQLQN